MRLTDALAPFNFVKPFVLLDTLRVVNGFRGDEARYAKKWGKTHPLHSAAKDSPPRADQALLDPQTLLKLIFANHRMFPKEVDITPDGVLHKQAEELAIEAKIKYHVKKSFRAIKKNQGLSTKRPGKEFYHDLEIMARELGINALGYTEVPNNRVFQNQFTLYPNAIVCIQELKSSYKFMAPRPEAHTEDMRVYAYLGEAVCRLADWMRERGVAAHAGHPIGGISLYPALAQMAGLGEFGRSGLLITPQFGPRQRIAVIYTPLEDMPRPAGEDGSWIPQFCSRCNLCVKHCPGGAIRKEPVRNPSGTSSCVDILKCVPWFALKASCGVCMKVCPFARLPHSEIKAAWEEGKPQEVVGRVARDIREAFRLMPPCKVSK